MTIEPIALPTPYTVAGLGPYTIDWPYISGAVVVQIETDTGFVTLAEEDLTLDPPMATVAGDLYLSAEAAAEYAGGTLWISRNTPVEQGWLGTAPREKSLEAGLDLLTMALQDSAAASAGAVRVLGATLPPTIPTADSALVWNEDGTAVVAGPTVDQIGAAQGYAEATAADRVQTGLDRVATEAAAEQAIAFSSPYTETDAAIAIVTVPAGAKVITRLPTTESAGQVAPVGLLTWWKRTTPPTSEPYFTTAGGVVWTQTALREQDVLSTLQTAIAAAFTDPSFAGVQPFSSRAALIAATIPAPVMRVQFHSGTAANNDLRVMRCIRTTGTCVCATSNGGTVNWAPDGMAHIRHWGAIPRDASSGVRTSNTTAILAAVAASLQLDMGGGWYAMNGSLVLDKQITIYGDKDLSLVMNTNNTSGIIIQSTAPTTSAFSPRVKLINLRWQKDVSTTSTDPEEVGLWIRNGQSTEILGCFWNNFISGLRNDGGQSVTLSRNTWFVGNGSPTPGSYQVRIAPHVYSGGFRPVYVFRCEDYICGSKLAQYSCVIEAGDSAQFQNGYMDGGYTAHVVANPTLTSGQAIFSNVYFDGLINQPVQTEIGILTPANTTGHLCNLAFVGGTKMTASDAMFDCDQDNALHELDLGSSTFRFAENIGVIKGRTGTNGLKLTASGALFGNASSGGLTIDGANSVNLDATLHSVLSANVATFTGTIEHLSYELVTPNSNGNIVDTSTGRIRVPARDSAPLASISATPLFIGQMAIVGGSVYIAAGTASASDWVLVSSEVSSGTTTPSVTFGGASVGVTYSERTCTWQRTGNVVTFFASVVLTSKGTSTGEMRLDMALPTVAAKAQPAFLRVNNLALDATDRMVVADIQVGTSQIRVSEMAAGSYDFANPYTDAQVRNDSVFRISGMFEVTP